MQILIDLFDANSPYFEHIYIKPLVMFSLSCLLLLLLRFFKTKLSQQPQTNLLGASLFSAYSPAKSLALCLVVYSCINLIDSTLKLEWQLQQYPILQLLLAIHVSWYGFRVVNTLEKATLKLKRTNKLDSTAVISIAKISRLALSLILIIVGFDLLGLDASGLIAMGSVSGAALAFASKDLVSNWFGGIMLHLDKPFKVGDWIRSPDREIEGVVEYIGWRMSIIRTFDKRPLYVPNAMFNNITVQNPSRMTHRRIKESIGVRYEDIEQVKLLVTNIESYLRSSERIAQDQVIIVNFNGFGASSLDILIYCMTVTTDWITFHKHKQIILLDIADIVAKHQCEFAFPTQSLHIESQAINEA